MHLFSLLPPHCFYSLLGAGGVWAFQQLLASILETTSFFPVPAPFMKETMQTYSECLVHHLGPQALWHRDFVQWLTPSLSPWGPPTPNPRDTSSAFSKLLQKEMSCLVFPRAWEKYLWCNFKGNNSDNSKMYPLIPFGLFMSLSQHFSPSFFLPLRQAPGEKWSPPKEWLSFFSLLSLIPEAQTQGDPERRGCPTLLCAGTASPTALCAALGTTVQNSHKTMIYYKIFIIL